MKTYNCLFDAFIELYNMFFHDDNEDILQLPYAEYSIQCWILYKDKIVNEMLCIGSRCSKMFSAIGIVEPHDQFLHLIHAFYLSMHFDDKIDI